MWWIFGGRLTVNFARNNKLEICCHKLHHVLHGETRNVSPVGDAPEQSKSRYVQTVFCENLRLRNAVLPSENQQKSAKLAPFVPFTLSLLIPLDFSAKKKLGAQRFSQELAYLGSCRRVLHFMGHEVTGWQNTSRVCQRGFSRVFFCNLALGGAGVGKGG